MSWMLRDSRNVPCLKRAGGMPDLLLWNTEKKKAKLVEVKSQRDRLSDSQRAWMLTLIDAGLDAEVFKVTDKA